MVSSLLFVFLLDFFILACLNVVTTIDASFIVTSSFHNKHPTSNNIILPRRLPLLFVASDSTTPSVNNDQDFNGAIPKTQQYEKSNTNSNTLPPPPPSFWSALWGIATNGSPWDYMLQLRRQGYDGIVPIDLKFFGGVYNFLLSPESVRSVTVEEAATLPRRFSVPLFSTLELDRGVVYEQGERHKRNKKLCIPSFEQSISMEQYVSATRNELERLSEQFQQVALSSNNNKNNNNMIDLYAELRRSTLNVVLDVTFGLGHDSSTSFTKANELSITIGQYLERIVALANEIPPLWQINPRLSRNYVLVTDTLLPRLRSLVANVIASRRFDTTATTKSTTIQNDIHNQSNSATTGCPNHSAPYKNTTTVDKNTHSSSSLPTTNRADLLSVLVQQESLSDSDIQSILFDVVIAGSDTTASTMTAALYLLHQPQHQSWLEKARKEAIDTQAAQNVPLQQLRSTLPVTTAIAREVLRLYPPVPFVGRTAVQDGTLINGTFPVKPGDTFCFSPWYLGRDPEMWGGGPDKSKHHDNISQKEKYASTMDPQRWLDDPFNGGAPTMFSWLPFGAGPRGCLGTRLGLTEVILGVSRLLLDFEFTFETTGPLPVKYDLTLNLDKVMNCHIASRKKENIIMMKQQ